MLHLLREECWMPISNNHNHLCYYVFRGARARLHENIFPPYAEATITLWHCHGARARLYENIFLPYAEATQP